MPQGRRRLAAHKFASQCMHHAVRRPDQLCYHAMSLQSMHHATPAPSVPQRVAALLVARGMGSHGYMWGRAQSWPAQMSK
jgi:hypothetical protein